VEVVQKLKFLNNSIKENKMKNFILVFVLCIAIFRTSYAQEDQQNNSGNLYTFFVNVVGEQFRFPLFGFVNIAGGTHNSLQIGFVNWNKNNFTGLQLGFINTVSGNMDGFQMGFVNTTAHSFAGFQFGFVNTGANGIDGAQISFMNSTKNLNGLQLGFINYVDSIEQGIPVGFVSIVRKGGYRAIELGGSELSPFNASFKIGVERFYTSFIVSYNPFRDGVREQIMLGAGFGTIIRLNEKFFINSETTSNNAITGNFQHYLSFVPYIGCHIISNLSVVAGPSIVWAYADKDASRIFYNISQYTINENNKLYFGARAAVRFSW
jgi:hypothetical protein